MTKIIIIIIFIVDIITDVPDSPLPHPAIPSHLHHTVVWYDTRSLADLFQSRHPLPSEICQAGPCVHAPGPILFISLFCLLG